MAVGGLGLLGLGALGAVAAAVGPAALPLGSVLALVPLLVVLLTIRWIDGWEPEPRAALGVAFAWGAGVSVLVALVLNTGAMLVLVASGSAESSATVWGATAVAPVVEETVKGLGVLLVALVWRRFVDGPVDGIVYAATVAAGFAFVENILYFGTALAEGAELGDSTGVAVVFFLRAVLSPFAHVTFTLFVGLALGLVAHRRGAWLWAFPVGLLAAIVLHALWNGSATLGGGGAFLVVYLVTQVPVFGVLTGLVVWLRRHEGRILAHQLAELTARGWFSPLEARMLGSLAERRRARAWAAGLGGRPARTAMRAFQEAATGLALQRHRAASDRAHLGTRHEEAVLLAHVNATRVQLVHVLPGR